MKDINSCPSTLMEGFKTYSPKGIKSLWDGKRVNHALDFNIDEFRTTADITEAMHRISVSKRPAGICNQAF